MGWGHFLLLFTVTTVSVWLRQVWSKKIALFLFLSVSSSLFLSLPISLPLSPSSLSLSACPALPFSLYSFFSLSLTVTLPHLSSVLCETSRCPPFVLSNLMPEFLSSLFPVSLPLFQDCQINYHFLKVSLLSSAPLLALLLPSAVSFPRLCSSFVFLFFYLPPLCPITRFLTLFHSDHLYVV